MTDDDIVAFTAISDDRGPLRHDREAAASTPFGGIVVQGGVTTVLAGGSVAA